MELNTPEIRRIEPGSFLAHDHWYLKAWDTSIHPMVEFFMQLDRQVIIQRYCHLHPGVKPKKLYDLVAYLPRYFPWSGADLMKVTNRRGKKNMVVIENNSCPSGQKSMPLVAPGMIQGGYRELIENSFAPYCRTGFKPSDGVLAVLYDKNEMETSGYAGVMADYFREPIYLVPFYDQVKQDNLRIVDGWLEILTEGKSWKRVYAAFRYVTQKPWNRIPVVTKTKIYNPIMACLAGGRNKLMAAKAYSLFNHEWKKTGLKIRTPETICDVEKKDIPRQVKKLGGQAVVKVPYSNAGQGVFTIVNKHELEAFLDQQFEYRQFIVQSLIGHPQWNFKSSRERFFHIGTLPNEKGETYVFDVRMMICATPSGFKPLSVYSRRAELPLSEKINSNVASWDSLGTNLSHQLESGNWTTDRHRLLVMGGEDFNLLGLGLDDLIEAFIQTVLSTVAIDQMAKRIANTDGKLKRKRFGTLDDDPALIQELLG